MGPAINPVIFANGDNKLAVVIYIYPILITHVIKQISLTFCVLSYRVTIK